MIKNLKLSEDFKKRIVAGGLGLVLMTSTGALGVSIHNTKEIKRLSAKIEEPASTIVDIDTSKEEQKEMSKEEQERLEQFNQTVDEYKKHREELEQNGDEKLYLDELFLMKYQDNGNTKYAVIKRWGDILYTSYYPEYTYLVYSNAEKKGFWDAIKFFNNNHIGYNICNVYSGLNEEFYAVCDNENMSFLPEEYVRYDEIVPLRFCLNTEEFCGMVFRENGLDKIYLSDVEQVGTRMFEETEKNSQSLTK